MHITLVDNISLGRDGPGLPALLRHYPRQSPDDGGRGGCTDESDEFDDSNPRATLSLVKVVPIQQNSGPSACFNVKCSRI